MTPLWQGRKNWGVDGRQSPSDKSERRETGSPSARYPDKNKMSALGRTSSTRQGANWPWFKNPTLSFVWRLNAAWKCQCWLLSAIIIKYISDVFSHIAAHCFGNSSIFPVDVDKPLNNKTTRTINSTDISRRTKCSGVLESLRPLMLSGVWILKMFLFWNPGAMNCLSRLTLHFEIERVLERQTINMCSTCGEKMKHNTPHKSSSHQQYLRPLPIFGSIVPSGCVIQPHISFHSPHEPL